jgi:hypothetical protein
MTDCQLRVIPAVAGRQLWVEPINFAPRLPAWRIDEMSRGKRDIAAELYIVLRERYEIKRLKDRRESRLKTEILASAPSARAEGIEVQAERRPRQAG